MVQAVKRSGGAAAAAAHGGSELMADELMS